jgi:ankyrin repeat protein
MNLRLNDIKDEAFDTCSWLLKHKNYTTWLSQHRGLLWIKGKPGAGKSTLLKYAIRECKQQESPKKPVVASFFFHGRGADMQKTPLGLFRSLLHQILDQIPELLPEFSSLFKKKCETEGKPGEKWKWHEGELRIILKDYIWRAPEAYLIRIYVDALDECGEAVARELVEYFQRLTSKATLNVCFSCRHYPIVALEHGLTVCVEDGNHDDIVTYVRGKFESGFSEESEARELETTIVNKAKGVFQWVVLVVPSVLDLHWDGKSIKAIRHEIQKIPAALDSLYQDILERIKDRTQSLQLMQWICFAKRPLLLEELRFAMAIDADTPYSSLRECQESEAYADTNNKMERRVKSLSGGLAEVKEQKNQKIAQFIHQSVNDYLIQSGLQKLDGSSENSVIGRAQFRLSRSCIKYITMREVLSYSSENGRDFERRFPFLRYAATHWISHAEVVEAERISQVDLLGLFQWPSNRIPLSWTQLYQKMDRRSDRRLNINTTLLHVASRYGLLSVITAVVNSEDNVDVDSKDEKGRTPLLWAAANGHETVVKLLLDKEGVDPDSKDKIRRTPLWWAAANGHETVVKLLLDREGVDPDSKDTPYGQTPLWQATASGHEAVVKLLLNKDGVDPDSKDDFYGRTPLWRAAANGHDAVVKLLLDEEGVDPDSKDAIWGRTPLWQATTSGHKAVVKLLLAKEGVDPDFKDTTYGRAPLWRAAAKGHDAVVKLLQSRGALSL